MQNPALDYAKGVKIHVNSLRTAPQTKTPVSVGVPFARGLIKETDQLTLSCGCGCDLPFQKTVTCKWPDGSVKWLLLDFMAECGRDYAISTAKSAPMQLENPVSIESDGKTVTIKNGLLTYTANVGDSFGLLTDKTGAQARVTSKMELCDPVDITSKLVIESFDVYQTGPNRAAVSIYGKREYSDGMKGPFSQRVEMFANCGFIRVEDTLVIAHIPGTHAKPENKLALWQVEKEQLNGSFEMRPYIDPEEAEGLVVSENAVAFWGLEEPFDLSRHTDDNLTGEDCPGMALGVAKSCACLIGTDFGTDIIPDNGVFAHVDPETYAYSGALGYFAPKKDDAHPRLENGLDQGLGLWLWFQDNDPYGFMNKGPWHGLFDWGDFQVRFSEAMHEQPVGWQYYDGRYGWDCGEMDTVFMLWTAFMHTGDKKYWRSAVAMSRHSMDVDMINVDYREYDMPEWAYDWHSYGAPWKEGYRLKPHSTVGIGRRHNVQHWGNGIGDTRHTFNAGAGMYYLLTGNRRALDSVKAMADLHMIRLDGHAGGEFCLSLEDIHWAWKLTGDTKYIDELKFRISALIKLRHPTGAMPYVLDFKTMSNYPELGEPIPTATTNLTLDYISNALCDYHYETEDPEAYDLLIKMAECLLNIDNRIGCMYYPDTFSYRILAWAYIQTKDERYKELLEYFVYTLATDELPCEPKTAEEWIKATYTQHERQKWQIRHIGPGLRMIPYAIAGLDWYK